jgi:hypothetical protein
MFSVVGARAFSALPRDSSLFSMNLEHSQPIFGVNLLMQVGSNEMPAMMRPVGMFKLGGKGMDGRSDPDMSALSAAFSVADELSSNPRVSGQARAVAVQRLQGLRTVVSERLQRDAHRNPTACLEASAAIQPSVVGKAVVAPSAAVVNAVRRRMRICAMISELEAQIRPLSKKDLKVATVKSGLTKSEINAIKQQVQAAVANIDGAVVSEQMEALNRNARKPRAANKGKRPVSRAARRLKNPRATRVTG